MAFHSYTVESILVTCFGNILQHSRVAVGIRFPSVNSMVEGSLDLILFSQGAGTLIHRSEAVTLFLG